MTNINPVSKIISYNVASRGEIAKINC